MSKSTIKTLANDASVEGFIESVDDETKKQDSLVLLQTYTRLTGQPAKMWGTSIIGFGQYHYKSDRSSQEGDWPLIGFSPRKQNLTLYFMNGFDDYVDLLSTLGKYKVSKSCLYINKLSDVDIKVLETLISLSYREMSKQHSS